MSGVGDPVAIFTALNDAAVDYVVIGGHAVRLHGAPHTTEDVDVMIAPGRKNRERLERALLALSARTRSGPFIAAHWPSQAAHLGVETDGGRLDVIEEGLPPLSWTDVRRDACTIPLGGVDVPVVSLRHLATMKRLANRVKDRSALDALTQIHGPLPEFELPDLDY